MVGATTRISGARSSEQTSNVIVPATASMNRGDYPESHPSRTKVPGERAVSLETIEETWISSVSSIVERMRILKHGTIRVIVSVALLVYCMFFGVASGVASAHTKNSDHASRPLYSCTSPHCYAQQDWYGPDGGYLTAGN